MITIEKVVICDRSDLSDEVFKALEGGFLFTDYPSQSNSFSIYDLHYIDTSSEEAIALAEGEWKGASYIWIEETDEVEE